MALTQAPQIAILNRNSSLFDIIVAVETSAGAADAFKPVCLNEDGVLDPILTGTGVIANASASLAAGSLVNLYNVGSVLTARPASAASGTNHPATGFVVDGFATNDAATVYLSGRFNYLDTGAAFNSSDVGAAVYLSATTPGAITKTAPTPPDADQVVGYVIGFSSGSPNIVTVSFGTGVRNFAQLDGVCQISQGGTSATTASAALTNLLAGSYTANRILASPNGAPGNITLRQMVTGDIPNNIVATASLATVLGTGSHVQLTNGTSTVNGDVVTYDGFGNTVDSGTLLSSLAPLASPTFTGTATIPNASVTGALTFTTANPTFFSATGSGAVVLATSPTLVTPNIGAATGTSLALGGGTPLATTNQTGTGNLVLATSPALLGNPEIDGAHGEKWIQGQATEDLVLDTGNNFTDTSANLLPANAIIEAVTARVLTTITTATTWRLGDPTTDNRFTADDSTLTAGETRVGINQWNGSVTTDAAGPTQPTAAKVRVKLDANPGAGEIRITVFYRQFVAPTS